MGDPEQAPLPPTAEGPGRRSMKSQRFRGELSVREGIERRDTDRPH